jgi:hypothetical protein
LRYTSPYYFSSDLKKRIKFSRVDQVKDKASFAYNIAT